MRNDYTEVHRGFDELHNVKKERMENISQRYSGGSQSLIEKRKRSVFPCVSLCSLLCVTITLICLSTSISYAQQRVQFSQYMVNQYALNPAAGGIDADLDLCISYRKQWVNFKGGPETYYFSGNMPVRGSRKPGRLRKQRPYSAVGALIFNDVTGPLSKSSFLGSYSYNMPITGDLRVSAGIFAGFTQLSLDHTQLKFDQEGESFSQQSYTLPDGSFGLWFYSPDFYLGVSANQLFYNQIRFLEEERNLVLHYYLTGGVKVPLKKGHGIRGISTTYLVPSLMLKYGGWGTSPSLDLNLKAHLNKSFWIGTSHRWRDSQVFMAGLRFKGGESGKFELAYSYDYTLTKINKYTSGSHELTLRYFFWQRDILCPAKFW